MAKDVLIESYKYARVDRSSAQHMPERRESFILQKSSWQSHYKHQQTFRWKIAKLPLMNQTSRFFSRNSSSLGDVQNTTAWDTLH